MPKALTPEELTANGAKIARLWAHETYRVFADRLIDKEDRELFFSSVKVRFFH